MNNKKLPLYFIIVSLVFFAGCTASITSDINREGLAKFEPPAGKVIVFSGQDNASVGGNAHFDNGYVDNIGVPGGITHYVYMAEGWKNDFGYTFDIGHIDGLYKETTWAAGPMCMKYYVDSPILDNCVMHLSISLEGNNEDNVADGSFDYLIKELIKFLKEYNDTPFLIRIGYEFEGSWNGYDPQNFKGAFQRITDKLRSAGVTNFATVMAASSFKTPYEIWEKYWPGDDYVDWVGYSYWGGNPADSPSLKFARDKAKPVFIAEITPLSNNFLDKVDGKKLWQNWYTVLFQHIDDNIDVIKAISYINCNWDAQPMWKGKKWGDTRIQLNDYIKHQWLKKMQLPRFINAEDKPFSLIGF